VTRKRLPEVRPSLTHKVEIQGADLYIIAGYFPDTGDIGEIFINIGKQGSTLRGFVDSWAILMSIAMQTEGSDLDAIITKFKGQTFEPNGMTTNTEIPECTSLLDYMVRWIEGHRKVELKI
jgi:ribonucleoside-diphosphate reductase alpha chain